MVERLMKRLGGRRGARQDFAQTACVQTLCSSPGNSLHETRAIHSTLNWSNLNKEASDSVSKFLVSAYHSERAVVCF